MAQDLYIGVDGGGTKCKVRIEDGDRKLLGQSVGGPANIRFSVEVSWQNILKAIDAILKPLNISLNDSANYHLHACLGLAGCELAQQREAFVNYLNPFKTIHLTSDAHIACVGAHHGSDGEIKDGAIIVIGTGAVGYQSEAGETVKVSGWGFPHDDIGGGAWLGLEAVKQTLQWLDHRADKSPLVEDIFAYFNKDQNYFISWMNQANATEFARLAPMVINHAQQEEIAALRLLKKAAHAIDKISHALIKSQKQHNAHLPCCLVGGIAPFIETYVGEELRDRLAPRKDEPTVGALLLIRDHVTKARQEQLS